ncbi:MAG: DUF2911 domain-containing protein, partial [Myxococcota bacterium]
MKNGLQMLFSSLLLLWGSQAFALDLPRKSPKASVSQHVGVTKISVMYYSPAVRGRKIWGKLVPYEKVWRTGANAGTQITFSEDVKLQGQAVQAGSYYIFTVPRAAPKSWTFFLSRDGRAWQKPFNPKESVVNIEIKPTEIPARERLAFQFTDTTESTTKLHLEWEKVRVSVEISAPTDTIVT